jgi:hypothetical protein
LPRFDFLKQTIRAVARAGNGMELQTSSEPNGGPADYCGKDRGEQAAGIAAHLPPHFSIERIGRQPAEQTASCRTERRPE